MAEYKGVMVLCEIAGGKLAGIATEALGAGRKLANDLKEELAAVLIGSGVSNFAADAIKYGADKVYVVDDALLNEYHNDGFIAAMEKVVRQVNPQIVITGQTSIGRDLAPRLAFRLQTSATLDCIELAIDPGTKRLLQTKPVYGGNARGIYTIATNPQIATVRTKAMTPMAPDAARKGEVIKVDAGLQPAALKAKMLQKVKEEIEGIKLEEAQIVVSGGRGIGGPDGFKILAELAKPLKAATGASRPPCDNGWVPSTMQVGLTGKIIAPEVYFAIAISGSSQHMSGCSGSKNIIAINKDPEANIFREARFGVVGDWKKVVPALTAKVKELVG